MSNSITKEELQKVYDAMPLTENSIREEIGIVLGFWDSIILLSERIKENQDAIK